MRDTFEEKYMDVLHNIEFGIMRVYREHSEMSDWEALRAVESLIRVYQAEMSGHAAPALNLKPLAEEVYDSIKVMCDWRLGDGEFLDDDHKPVNLPIEPKSLEEIIACLKRIRRSIELWNKEGGRQGYLNFVSNFVA